MIILRNHGQNIDLREIENAAPEEYRLKYDEAGKFYQDLEALEMHQIESVGVGASRLRFEIDEFLFFLPEAIAYMEESELLILNEPLNINIFN